MAFSVEYRRPAARYLKRMATQDRERILDAIEEVASAPDGHGLDVKKLRNRDGFRLRVGGYRVLFERHDDRLVILVVAVGPRGDVYKR